MIELRCPGCRRELSLPDAVAGKAVRCAHCREIMQVPAPVRPPRETRLRNAPNTAIPATAARPVQSAQPAAPRPRPEPYQAPPRRRSSPLLALVILGVMGLALFVVVGLIGAGVWFYMDRSSATAESQNNTASPAVAAADTPKPETPIAAEGGELSAQSLARLKRMSVFIKSDFGFAITSGTGFVVRVENRAVYIVTNDHVARGNPLSDDDADHPGRHAARGSRITPRRTTVVFDSGTRDEREFAAQIIATDDLHDLAILKVADMANPPQPVDLSNTPELRETLQVYVLGFPFSRLLGGGRNPAITVGKASISSLRYDRANRLSRVQLQGSINPGNSGGPIVDSHGRLVGVAVSTVLGTGIGFAIPPQDVLDLLQHRNSRIGVSVVRSDRDEAEVEFQVELMDLVAGVREVKVLYLLGQALPPEATRAVNGRYPMLPNSRELVLNADRGKFTGRLTVRATELVQNQLPYQIVYTTGSGQTLCNAPTNQHVAFGAVAATPPPANQNPNPPVAAVQPKAPNVNPNPNPRPRTPRTPRTRPNQPVDPPIEPPPPFVPPETTITLEAPATQAAVGGGGRFLILHLATTKKLVIFDLKQRKVVKSLPLNEDQALFAAGQSLLIVALPKAGVFERWNLNTFQREAEVPSPGIGGIKALAMGNASDELLLTFIPGGSPNMGLQLIDPKTFRSSPIEIETIPNQHFGLKFTPEACSVCMSANAKTITVRGQFTWTSLVRDGNKYRAFTFGADTPRPSPDGNLLIAHGQIFSADGKPMGPKHGGGRSARVWCAPAVQGDYYLSFNQIPKPGTQSYLKTNIHRGSEEKEILTLPKNDFITELVDWFWGKPKPFEQHVFLLPNDKVLVLLSSKGDRLDFYPVSIPK